MRSDRWWLVWPLRAQSVAPVFVPLLFGCLQDAAAQEGHEAGVSPATSIIGFYQRHVSDLRQTHCPFSPSCSQYAVDAVHRHGLLVGAALACDRLVRCNTSARRYYVRGSDRRLLDPVEGEAPSRVVPRVPSWLLPSIDVEPPLQPAGPSKALEYASFATALAQDGDCDRASTEYRRASYMADTPEMAHWAYMRSGACFYDLERWQTAAEEFLHADGHAQTDAEQHTARRLAAACQFNDGNFAASEALLRESNSPVDDDTEALVLLGLCDMAVGRWGDARQRLTGSLEGPLGRNYPARLHYLIDQTTKGERLPHRSAGFAGALSLILPGSGQVYCGRVQDGLRHLIFNGALIYTIVELARDEHYAAAYLVSGIELPFYLGNILGARRTAQAFDRKARLSFVASTLETTER